MYSSLFFNTRFLGESGCKDKTIFNSGKFFFAAEWYVFDNTLSDSGLDVELFLILYWEWSVEGCCMVWKVGLFGGFEESFLTEVVDKSIMY